MYACIHKISGGFFEGMCGLEDRPLTFRDPPPTLAFANGSMPVSSPGILAAVNKEIRCPKILWLAISPKAGIGYFPTLY
jgi:hypothetical protein